MALDHSLLSTATPSPPIGEGNPPLRSQTTSLPCVWRTPSTRPPRKAARPSGHRNTRQPFSAHCVQSDSHELTTCDHIYGHIQTSVHLYAQYVARLLLVNMIENDTRACILGKRSSSAKVTSRQVGNGVAVDGSLVPMPWVDTSGLKLGASASSLSLTRKFSSDNGSGKLNTTPIWQRKV